MSEKTIEQVITDGRADAKSLKELVNGEPGIVTTQTGTQYKNLPKLVGEFEQTIEAASGTTLAGLQAVRDETYVARDDAAVSETAAQSAQTNAEAARDASLLSKGIWPTTESGIGQGVQGTSALVAGSGGTDGTFDLVFSGGTQVIAPAGRFVVSGGSVTQVIIDYSGYYSAGTPTISFDASAGLTGASVSAVMGANTPVGGYFSVPDPINENFLLLYKVTSGPNVLEVEQYPSSVAVKKINETVTPIEYRTDDVYQFIDKNMKKVLRIGKYGDLQPSSYADAMVFAPPSEVSEHHNLRVISQTLSLDGKIIQRQLTDGSTEDFAPVDPDPTPVPSVLSPLPVFAGYRLREYRRKRQQIKAGVANTRLNVACIGDSWTDNRAYWLKAASEQLKEKYGNGGQFFGAGGLWGGGGDALSGAMSEDNDWTEINFTVPTPHLRALESSTVGAKLTITDAEGESASLSFLGGTGVARYRWAGGSWQSITLDGSDTQWRDLTAPPAGQSVFEIEVVSGTCRIYGLLLENTSGITLYKMAAASTRASQWTAVDRQQWIDAITPLNIDVAVIMFGTNDVYGYNAETFVTVHLPELVSRVKEAAPNADILIASPPVNLATNIPSTEGQNLPAFAAASRIWAETNNAAHLDTQFYFGDDPSEYGDVGSQYFLAADAYHPAPNGQAVLAESILTTLEQN